MTEKEWTEAAPPPVHRYLFPKIEQLLPPAEGQDILDLGSGTGYVASRLADRNRVTGIDLNSERVAIARSLVPEATFHEMSVYDDLRTIAPPEGFDVIIAVEVIEHLISPARFLENTATVLKPDGWLILTTPYHGFLKNLAFSILDNWDYHFQVHTEGGHIKFFSPRTLTAMLKNAGFERPRFAFAGRAPWLWKCMVCRTRKISGKGEHSTG